MGFTIVIQVIIWKQRLALSGSMPPSVVMGFVSRKIAPQQMMMITSAMTESFFSLVFPAGSHTLAHHSHQADTDTNGSHTV